tara:strand:+ start:1187 stop:1561 length:375 start_codon:yes stop_codon:yes gene_type:complete
MCWYCDHDFTPPCPYHDNAPLSHINLAIKRLERFKQRSIKTLRMMYHESVMLGANTMNDQARFEADLERQEGILCKINEKLEILKDKKAILCNQENAVKTPVEPVCLADATSEPNEQKEAQKQR